MSDIIVVLLYGNSNIFNCIVIVLNIQSSYTNELLDSLESGYTPKKGHCSLHCIIMS